MIVFRRSSGVTALLFEIAAPPFISGGILIPYG